MSPEFDLMTAPRPAYAALARTAAGGSLVTALRRPALVALVLGVAVAIASTRSVSPALVLSTTLAWSYIVVLQLAIALPLVAPGARRTVGLARALDLFFAGHAPWSLFVLAAAAWGPSPAGRPLWPLAILAAAPLALTPRIVHAFFLEVLRLDAAAARRRTIAQQATTWTAFVAINWMASAFVPRIQELGARW